MGKDKKGRGRRRRAPIGEINVTPLVDVMLVLLIVFMVASPLMAMGVAIDLPKAAANPIPLDKPPVSITVSADGGISVDREPVAEDELLALVAQKVNDDADERLLIRGDNATAYGMVMKVMGLLSSAGYNRIGLVTEPEAQP
ncbi:biopolymer transporter ExbD [Devosia sp. YIM 151766]|uniref:ExbD/TolR family protein n=1 Tax=Devosia sp. YIM 151766 TaxID=3017325 RepID=UPI00255CF253|nr:biopolymer transporter ExbD [Devosia sp. YIM 151766]WIY52923.1 biopolymer transporter ExbD [Devosia sp. YIM 151766]